VDLNLVLALDVSKSVSERRWDIQRQGYALAFSSLAIQQAILSGAIGAIASTAVLWSARTEQQQVIPWTVLDSPEMIGTYALLLSRMHRPFGSETGIGAALKFAEALFPFAPQARRSVIDISGDGEDNSEYWRDERKIPVTAIRDEIVARGITINGLALWGSPDFESSTFSNAGEYYEARVIGGDKHFHIDVTDPDRKDLFVEALERKLLREIVA
jgi:hypothetical protein